MGDRSTAVWGVGIAFFIISWTAVGLRIWVRAGMIKSFGRDDWTMVGTQLLNTAYLACQLGGLVYGTGRHIEDLEPARAEKALTVCDAHIPELLHRSSLTHATVLAFLRNLLRSDDQSSQSQHWILLAQGCDQQITHLDHPNGYGSDRALWTDPVLRLLIPMPTGQSILDS